MSISLLVVMAAGITAVLVTANTFSPILRLPTPTLQLLLGCVATNIVVMMGIDTGLRFDNFHDMVFYLFLPLLVFVAAWEIDLTSLRANLSQAASLALFGLLITTAIAATVIYFAINHPSGFPWAAALLTGALLAATDPAAVTSQAWIHHVRPRLALLLEGESLLNDATAVVLFTVILGLALGNNFTSTSQVFIQGAFIFAQELFGGAIIGLGVGWLATAVQKHLPQQTQPAGINTQVWFGLSVALFAYHGALQLHVSGVIACLVLGLMLGKSSHHEAHQQQQWHFIGETTNGILFVLMGATITFNMFSERWLAMLFAIGGVMLARFISVHTVLGLLGLKRTGRVEMADRNYAGLLGMRGAITIALVLTLPTDLPYWWTIQSIAYGVVLFDLVVVAPFIPWLLQRK